MVAGNAEFKSCTGCGMVWKNRSRFLSDPNVKVEGYQVNFSNLEEGIFLFTHMTGSCGSTIAVRAGAFTDMHDGDIFEERILGKEGCDQSCLHSGVIDSCRAKCECAYVRDVLQKVRHWKKS
jgi:hypothetical protein